VAEESLEQQRADEATARHALYAPPAEEQPTLALHEAPRVREPLATLLFAGATLLSVLVLALAASVILWGAVEVWARILS